MDIEEVKKEVAKIVKDELPHGCRSFFFGSRVTGTAGERADLDVGIEREDGEAIPFAVVSKIKARCEAMPTLITVDVADFSRASKDFKDIAKEKIEAIF